MSRPRPKGACTRLVSSVRLSPRSIQSRLAIEVRDAGTERLVIIRRENKRFDFDEWSHRKSLSVSRSELDELVAALKEAAVAVAGTGDRR